MAVNPALRNQFTCLETGVRREPKSCASCTENRVERRGSLCNPCQVIRFEERREQVRQRAKRSARPAEESVFQLGRAARRAGLTVADLEAMCPPLTPDDERLMSHG